MDPEPVNSKKTLSGIAESNSVVDSRTSTDSKKKRDELMNASSSLLSPASPTSILAKNLAKLPSKVARVKEMSAVPKLGVPSSGSSSGSATGNPRNKVALAPGHSLMDWIRLGSSGVDLTGVGGVPRVVSPAELARHNSQNDAWIAIRGIVYNVSRYMKFHPGGIPELMKGVGKDATKLFDDVHAWVNYQSILQKCVVGRLNRSSNDAAATTKATVSVSSAASNILSRCTKPTKSVDNDKLLSTPCPKMDWIQTSNAITLFYYSSRDYPAVVHQLTQIDDCKYKLRFAFDKHIVTHEIELSDSVTWPPKWKRNFESMKIEFTFAKKQCGLWKTYGTFTTLYEPQTMQRIYREYKIVSNLSISKLVHLMVLRADKYLEITPIGRHMEAKLDVMGTEVSRMYTPIPAILHPNDAVPGYDYDCACLMFKIYANGALTPSMAALQPGHTLNLSNSLGTFIAEKFQEFTIIHMLAAGSGLTAMLSGLQWALGRRNVSRVNLINFNKDEDNMFYDKKLQRIAESESRFTITHILSEPSNSWTGRRGKISADTIEDCIGDKKDQACVFTCGPRPFMESVKEILVKFGWNSTQLHEFDD